MEKYFTQQDINQFFTHFKKLQNSYKLEKVHQLINSPNAMAMHKVKFKYKPFKFIIMTSVLIIGLSSLLFWLTPSKTDNLASNKDSYRINYEHLDTTSDIIVDKPTEASVKLQQREIETVVIKNKNVKDKQPSQIIGDPIKNGSSVVDKPENIENTAASCNWPIDTTIDKHSLFINLSNDELLNLGVYLYADSMYYCNERPDSSFYANAYNAKGNKSQCNDFNFYLKYDSDTLCTKHRWGHPFYNKIDTLLPVVITISDETKILWFTPHSDIFTALPERYSGLKNTYRELICLKRKNPNHQIVNYWSKSRNQILEEVNYLTLNPEELENIGIEIFKDSISMVDPTESFKYLLDYKSLNCGTYGTGEIAIPEIPNMFPIIFTDIKGLNQGTYGLWIKNKELNTQDDIFNTLVPVLLPLSELITGKNYQLILWYYPTQDFLNALPPRYSKDIKAEIEYISTGVSNENAGCNYFEVCKSTLPIKDLKIYPNPAKYSITVEFKSPKAETGTISIVNIAGIKIIELLPKTSFIKGNNSFQFNLSGINSGIYLISINTNERFKTQRIIISK